MNPKLVTYFTVVFSVVLSVDSKPFYDSDEDILTSEVPCDSSEEVVFSIPQFSDPDISVEDVELNGFPQSSNEQEMMSPSRYEDERETALRSIAMWMLMDHLLRTKNARYTLMELAKQYKSQMEELREFKTHLNDIQI